LPDHLIELGEYVVLQREHVGDERSRLWRTAAEYYPGYDTYSRRTGGREIPVVVLERAAP